MESSACAQTETQNRFLQLILNDIQKNCLKLPTLPEMAMRVRKAVEDESSSAAQIARLVGTDAALSARLLRVVNSPMYRGARPIENLQAAVTRLGSKVVRNLVASLVMQQLFQAQSPRLRGRMQRLWEHSTEVAVIAQAFARKFTRLEPDQAMLAGLLHDIGVLPILSRAEDFPELLADESLLEETIERLHVQIGARLMESWQFPPELRAAVAEHEELDRYSAEVDYVDIVVVANLHAYIGTDHRHAGVNWADVPALAKLGLTPPESLLALQEAKAEMAEMRRLLA